MKKGILKKIGVPLAVVLVGVLVAMPVLASENNDYTRISNILEATVSAEITDDSVALSWYYSEDSVTQPGDEDFGTEALDIDLAVGDSFYIWVRAENTEAFEITRVLFLIFSDEVFTIERTDAGDPEWSGELPYGAVVPGAYHYGPDVGFPMPEGYVAYSEFKVTADVPGEYGVDVFAVQLEALEA